MEPLFEKLKSNAIANRQRIVLPESTEPRTLTAADRIIADGIADVVLQSATYIRYWLSIIIRRCVRYFMVGAEVRSLVVAQK